MSSQRTVRLKRNGSNRASVAHTKLRAMCTGPPYLTASMLESEMPHGAGSEAIGLVNRRSSIRGHQLQLLAAFQAARCDVGIPSLIIRRYSTCVREISAKKSLNVERFRPAVGPNLRPDDVTNMGTIMRWAYMGIPTAIFVWSQAIADELPDCKKIRNAGKKMECLQNSIAFLQKQATGIVV